MEYKKPEVISGIGYNHKGNMEIAKELLCFSKECNFDIALSYIIKQITKPREITY